MKCSKCKKKLAESVDNGVAQGYCKKCKNLEACCSKCNKPITHSDKNGMYCEDNCGVKEAERASKEAYQFVSDFLRIFP